MVFYYSFTQLDPVTCGRQMFNESLTFVPFPGYDLVAIEFMARTAGTVIDDDGHTDVTVFTGADDRVVLVFRRINKVWYRIVWQARESDREALEQVRTSAAGAARLAYKALMIPKDPNGRAVESPP